MAYSRANEAAAALPARARHSRMNAGIIQQRNKVMLNKATDPWSATGDDGDLAPRSRCIFPAKDETQTSELIRRSGRLVFLEFELANLTAMYFIGAIRDPQQARRRIR
jgi:hypothetical protein